jgi:signal transduction histidine kinase
MADDRLSFKISTGLKSIIGRDLITDDYVAVFELVKNAFDAHAKKVTITFKPDKITIEDDGKGMDLDDIKDKWLFVAYSAKKEGTEDDELKEKEFDAYRDKIRVIKYFAGAKGIGRFSCDRLGSKLTLTTKKASANSAMEQIVVDWDEFDEDPEEEFLDIKVTHRTIKPVTKKQKQFHNGTILEISELGSNWTRDKKVGLKQSLEKLINPFEGSSKDKFTIIIEDASEKAEDNHEKNPRQVVNGQVRNFIFETLDVKTTQIVTEIDDKGDDIVTTVKDRGTLVYKIRKSNDTKPKLTSIRFVLFFLNRKAKMNFTRLMGIQPAHFGSIFLYKNGFRIAPYGDRGDDSFGINTRQAQRFFARFGTRDVIGRIEIIGDNPHFREASNRNSGLVKNEYYDSLVKSFQVNCLAKLESYVKKVTWKTEGDKDRSDVSALDNIAAKSALLEVIAEETLAKDARLEDIDKNFVNLRTQELLEQARKEDLENLSLIASKFQNKQYSKAAKATTKEYERLKELERQLQEEEKARAEAEEEKRRLELQLDIERQKNTYLTATRKTLDDDAQGLIHSIKINTVKINSSIENLIRKITHETPSTRELLRGLTNIRFYSDRAFKISKLITRANFRSDRDKQTIDVSRYIHQYLSFYSDIFENTRLRFEIIDKKSSLYKKASVLDLSIILDNLISNSEKWKAKNVSVEMSNLRDGSLRVLFSDDGDGLVKKYLDDPEQIFELGVTETDGSGIGLHTVRSRLKKMNADISFAGNGKRLKGASFQLTFNK